MTDGKTFSYNDTGRMDRLSLKFALDTLKDLELTEVDAQVYIYLAKKGSREENALAEALKLSINQLNLCLENLLKMGMINIAHDESSKYFAIPFEKVLDDFVKATAEETETLRANRNRLISAWNSMKKKEC